MLIEQKFGDEQNFVILPKAITPEDIQKKVTSLKEKVLKRHSNQTCEKIKDWTTEAIVNAYVKDLMRFTFANKSPIKPIFPWVKASVSTMFPLPNIRLPFDMCLCIAECYEYDIISEDTQNLCMLLLLLTGTQKRKSDKKIFSSEVDVKMILQWLKNPTLQQQRDFGLMAKEYSRDKADAYAHRWRLPFEVYSIRRTGKIVKKWFDLAEGEEELAYLKKQPC